MNTETRPYASWLLSSLYTQLDMLCESESDLSDCLRAIEQAEAAYAPFLQPCRLCRKRTIFKDEAFDLPFCWACLQSEYHFWYRSEVYSRGAARSDGALLVRNYAIPAAP